MTAARKSAGIRLGLALALVGAVVCITPGGPFLEKDLGLTWLFRMRGPSAPPDDITIVGIDRTTGTELGLAGPDPRDWPRAVHARLIDGLAAAGARLIVFDLLFESDRGHDDDLLAAAMRRAGNVIVARDIDRRDLGQSAVSERLTPLAPRLRDAPLAGGPTPLADDEPVKTTFWTFLDSLGGAPTLPVVVAGAYDRRTTADLQRALGGLARRETGQGTAAFPEPASAAAIETTLRELREFLLAHPDEARALRARGSTGGGAAENGARLPGHALALLDILTGPERRTINLFGPSLTIARVSYPQALADVASPTASARYRDKIVFVGFSARDVADNNFLRDCHPTVLPNRGGVPVCGVELAATVFDNLRTVHSIVPLSSGATLLLVASIGMLVGIACLTGNTSVALGMVGAIVASYAVLAIYAFEVRGLWLPLVIPAFVIPATGLSASAWVRFNRSVKEREGFRQALYRLVPRAVADAIVASPASDGTYRSLVHGACLATDAQGYSTMAEKLQAAELASVVQAYMQLLYDCVKRHGGIVCGEAGDSIIAVWPGDAGQRVALCAQACATALDMANSVDRAFAAAAGYALPTRIGIHFGEFVLGVVGTADRLDFRAIGDTVNTAARIEAHNKVLSTRRLVSGTVAEGLQGFDLEHRGDFLPPGRSGSVTVYELLGTNMIRVDGISNRGAHPC